MKEENKKAIDPIGELGRIYGMTIVQSPYVKEPTLIIPSDYDIEKVIKEHKEKLGINK